MGTDGGGAYRTRGANRTYHLTPDTAPELIAKQQREEVAEYLAAHPRATEEQMSAALVLPVWSIRLRLAELRGEPVPYTNPLRKSA